MPLSNLRPVFFRLGANNKTHSGWLHMKTLEVWAHEDDAVTFSNERGDERGLLKVPNASLALTMGERVVFTKPVDLFPSAVIEAGERGVVGRRDKVTGATEIFLENHHIGLADAANCLAIRPHCDFDGVLDAIEPWGPTPQVDYRDYLVAA